MIIFIILLNLDSIYFITAAMAILEEMDRRESIFEKVVSGQFSWKMNVVNIEACKFIGL